MGRGMSRRPVGRPTQAGPSGSPRGAATLDPPTAQDDGPVSPHARLAHGARGLGVDAMTAAEFAAQYVAHRWPVFPLKPRDKIPLTATGFKDSTCDAAQVGAWWTQTPDANIGCVPAQTGHLVIDIDGPEGEAAAQTLGLLSEPTLTVTTARGRHLWFTHPGGTIGNVVLAPHLDVRADHGYVLLPPSVHPSGAVYRWVGHLADVKPLPPDVLARFNGQHQHPIA